MFIVTNDNSDAHLIRLQEQIDELRAEIDRLKASSAQPSNASFAEAKASTEFDRKIYMRDYMRRKRAEKKAAG